MKTIDPSTLNVPTVVSDKKYTDTPIMAPMMKIIFSMFLTGKNWSCSLSGLLCLLCGYCVSIQMLFVLLFCFLMCGTGVVGTVFYCLNRCLMVSNTSSLRSMVLRLNLPDILLSLVLALFNPYWSVIHFSAVASTPLPSPRFIS